MAKVHGIAGEWARVNGMAMGLWPLFLSASIGGFSLGVALFASVEIGLLMLALDAVFAFWSWTRGFRQVERFFVGARGEEAISELLSTLPDTYHVFNDFTYGRFHVDHVVVGPVGVFAIETKCWSGKVTLDDGHIYVGGMLPDRSPIDQARREANIVKAALEKEGWKGEVSSILVFASNTFAPTPADLHGVIVMNADKLVESFTSGRVVLQQMELERLVKIMESRGSR